jgi:hypothetical protein
MFCFSTGTYTGMPLCVRGPQVSSVLRSMGVPHTNELPVFRGLFHIDIAVQGGIALEVDGECSTMYFGCVCVNP